MNPVQTFILLVVYVPALIICVKLGNQKGHSTLGWAMGLLLGWIGVAVMLCVSKTHEQEVADAARRLRIEAEAQAIQAGR